MKLKQILIKRNTNIRIIWNNDNLLAMAEKDLIKQPKTVS